MTTELTQDIGVPNAASPDDFDDMHDDLATFPYGTRLADLLQTSANVIVRSYDSADRAALTTQRQHRWLTRLAVVAGTLAVLLAILQRPDLSLETVSVAGFTLAGLEPPAAIAAGVVVLIGILGARQFRWLLARHKAERCRFLKYSVMLDPVTWFGTQAEFQARLQLLSAEVARITALTKHDLDHWLEHDQLPSPPEVDTPPPISAELRQVINYYCDKRLATQTRYFSARYNQNARRDSWTRWLPALLFFGSVLAAAGHFIYETVQKDHGEPSVTAWLITAAAGFAALGAGVRTYRGAYEYSRNTARYRGKAIALSELTHRLRHEADPGAALRTIWSAEQILESEHREWLRLMVDAEWFG